MLTVFVSSCSSLSIWVINKNKSGSIVRAKDILLNITGGSIGRSALVPDDFDIANVNQHVIIIRLVDDGLRFFLHHVIISPYIQNQIISRQVGSGRGGLSAETLSTFLIPIPPVREQEDIRRKAESGLALVTQIAHNEDSIPCQSRVPKAACCKAFSGSTA